MKSRAIALAGAALMPPAAAWCAEGAGAEAAGGGSWFSLLFYVINFALFLWIVAHYAGGPVRKFFADRAARIRETLARAEATFKQAQDLANRAAERMARLEADKAQLRADLDAEAAYMANRIRELAREAAQRIKRDSELTAGALGEAAHRRVRELLAGATGKLARELVARAFTADDQARLLHSFEERLRQEAAR